MPPDISQQQTPMGLDINAIIQMLMEILTMAPEQPAGDIAGGTAPMGPPGFANTPDPQAAGLMQMLQMLQMQQSQSPQQGMNAVNGQMGAMGGFLGGRPPGS